MSSPWHSLLKKLHSVKDLKEAITHVKKSGLLAPEPIKKDEASSNKPGNVDSAPVIVSPSPAAPAPQQPKPASNMPKVQLLGRNKTDSGHTIFHIGHPGADTYYEVDMDLHAKRNSLPSFTVSHRKASGQLLDRHDKVHDSMENAIKAIINHHYNKAWE